MGANPIPYRSAALRLLAVVGLLLVLSAELLAFEAKVLELRARSATVHAALELKKIFVPRFKKLLEKGGPLYLKVQTELWEDRAMWDRLVRPASIATFRITRDPQVSSIIVSDAYGSIGAYPGYPDTLQVRLDLAPVSRIAEEAEYYVHVVATLGTIAESDIEQIGEAVFGPEEEAGGLAALGKAVMRGVLGMTDYVQSVSTQTTSRTFKGHEIKRGA